MVPFKIFIAECIQKKVEQFIPKRTFLFEKQKFQGASIQT